MKNNKKLSVQTMKILTGIGVVFGTVMVFFVSFFLSFSLMVNPIAISVGDEDIKQENNELKTQLKVLEDEVELLTATVEKYRSAASAPTPIVDSFSSSTTAEEKDNDTSSATVDPAKRPSSEESSSTPQTSTQPDDDTSITIIDISE